VGTPEGRIGPLLLGTESQSHFIEMPAGMYTEEHPHSSGSYIYTVRGRWVLASAGRRHLMKPGTLFTFAPDTPTGYEIPFDENAFILIFKDKRLSKDEREFIEYLRGLKAHLAHEHDEGHPVRLDELPDDHPARVFARSVNPQFDVQR
jgi:quercetin dioxygenase-like cupin family protein